jgi:hypothetical protein
LADRRPIAASAAAVLAAIPLVGWFTLAAMGLASVAGPAPDPSLVLPGPFPIVALLTTMPASLVFGVVGIGGGVDTRRAGLVTLLPALPFLGFLLAVLVLGPDAGRRLVIDSGHALAHLAVGVALRGQRGPADRAGPVPNANP